MIYFKDNPDTPVPPEMPPVNTADLPKTQADRIHDLETAIIALTARVEALED